MIITHIILDYHKIIKIMLFQDIAVESSKRKTCLTHKVKRG